jgi:hypothetical protein
MAIYTANVARTNINGAARFDINIQYGGVDVGVINDPTRDPSLPEITLTLTPLVKKANRKISHTVDQFDHDETHLYAKVTVLFDDVPAWLVEIFAQPDPDPPHVYWASSTRIDPNAPVSIDQIVQ